jgi:spore maturation protein CgeB
MRFIIPNYNFPDSFVDNTAYTLRQLGHEVISPERPLKVFNEKHFFLFNLVKNRIVPASLSPQEEWLQKQIKETRFDVLLVLTQGIREELLLECKKKGVVTIAWWGDTAANMSKQGLLCKGWDYIFIKDRYASFKLQTLGLNSHFLPEAMNPAWHTVNYKEINDDVLFAGNVYDYRHYLIRMLDENKVENIKLYGSGVPAWAHESVKKAFQNKYVIKEEKSRVFGSSLVCINSTAMSEGNSLNCRTFEIAGAGGLQIMEYREAILDCFEPGKEILTYSSLPELLGHIDRYKKDKAAAIAIREGGNKRVNNDHTYQKRIETIMKTALLH